MPVFTRFEKYDFNSRVGARSKWVWRHFLRLREHHYTDIAYTVPADPKYGAVRAQCKAQRDPRGAACGETVCQDIDTLLNHTINCSQQSDSVKDEARRESRRRGRKSKGSRRRHRRRRSHSRSRSRSRSRGRSQRRHRRHGQNRDRHHHHNNNHIGGGDDASPIDIDETSPSEGDDSESSVSSYSMSDDGGAGGGNMVSSFPQRLEREEHDAIDRLVSDFIIYDNQPFALCNSPRFRALMSTIVPGWSPMDRSVVSGRLLEDKKALIKSHVERVCVICDVTS